MRGLIRHFTRVHDDDAARAALHELNHLWIGESGHIVYDRRAHAHGCLRDLDVPRVDGNDRTTLGERTHDGQDAARLFVGVYRTKPGSRRLAAHIDDIRPRVEHRDAMGDRRLGIEVLTTVAERIGRDVEHAHDARAVEREGIVSAAPRFDILSHEGSFRKSAVPLLYPV